MSPKTVCHRIHFPAAVLGLAVLGSFTCAHAAEEDWTTGGRNHEKLNTVGLRVRVT